MISPGALQGLGAVANSPLGRGVLKYWWASAPIGYLAWHYWNERKKKGEANVGNLVHDLAPVVGVAVGLMMLNDTLARVEASSVAPAQPFQAATDAQFTVQPKA